MLRWIGCLIFRQHCEHDMSDGIAAKLNATSRCYRRKEMYGYRYECCRCEHVNYYSTIHRGPRIRNYRIK